MVTTMSQDGGVGEDDEFVNCVKYKFKTKIIA